jgi:hypothetical protein
MVFLRFAKDDWWLALRLRHGTIKRERAFLLILCVFFAQCSAAETVSIGQRLLYSRSYALIVAEDAYQDPQAWPRLDQVPAEVRDLKAALMRLGFDQSDIQIENNVESSKLLGVFQAFINDDKHRVETTRLFIFYAGHGYTARFGQSYIIPVDAPASTGRDFYEKALAIEAIRGVLAHAVARHTLVVFDSCFSGAIFGYRSEDSMQSVEFDDLSSHRIQVLTAGNASQKVPALSEFVPALIAGATGAADFDHDGIVTAVELSIYLKHNVKRTSPQLGDIGPETSGEFSFIPDITRVNLPTMRAASSKPSAESLPTKSASAPGFRWHQYSRTCTYNAGPKNGRTEYFPPELPVIPAEIGQSCQDGQGSYGIAATDDISKSVKVSSICSFTAGPRTGQFQDYAPMPAVPVGAACQDGIASYGIVVEAGSGERHR